MFTEGGNRMKLKILHRPRTEKILDGIWEAPVFFVTAPMGYGKTTVVKEYLSYYQACDVLWLTFCEQAKDAVYVWKQFHEMLYENQVLDEKTLCQVKIPETELEIQQYIREIDRCLNRMCICIFDDYDNGRNEVLNAIIERIAISGLTKLHLVIIERSNSDFPYEELYLKGGCNVLDQEDLRLTTSEIHTFAKENDCDFSWEMAEHLFEYTEGWMAAVYLCLLHYKLYGNMEEDGNVISLMRHSIFLKLPPETQDILVKLSVLCSFTLAQAAYLTGDSNAPRLLCEMEQNIGFIRYTPQKEIRLHSLLYSMLQEEFELRGYDKKEILKKNASWLRQQNKPVAALMVYSDLHEYEELFRVLHEVNNQGLFEQAPGLLYDIFKSIPTKYLVEEEEIYVLFLLNYIVRGDFKKGVALLEELKKYIKDQGEDKFSRAFMGKLYMFDIFLEFNNAPRMEQIVKEHKQDLVVIPEEIFKIQMRALYSHPEILSLFYREPGTYKQCVQESKNLIQQWLSIHNEQDGGWNDLSDAEYALETGNLEQAEKSAIQAETKAERTGEDTVLLSSNFVLLRCYLYLGRKSEFEKRLECLKNRFSHIENLVLKKDFDIIYSYVNACVGYRDHVSEWIARLDLTNCSNVMKNAGCVHITYGMYLLAGHRYMELQILSENMQKSYYDAKHCMPYLYSKCFSAIAVFHIERDGRQAACDSLKEVILIAKRDQLEFMFAEMGKEISTILSLLPEDEYICSVIKRCRKYTDSIRQINEQPSAFGLTPNEGEIMGLVCLGKQNIDIAEELHIATVTVEKALSSVYRKLGVRNRSAAILMISGMQKI